MAERQVVFKRAVRRAVKLKIGVDGPSGAGKTWGALALATGIVPGGRIALGDTENESASYYAEHFVFDTVPLETEILPPDIRAVIRAAVKEKYDVLVLDSASRAWTNLLALKDKYDLDNPTKNRFASWGLPQFGPSWEALMKDILDAPIHIIATMRSKQSYETVPGANGGKSQVVKLGLQPQVREGAEYEFGLVFNVEMNHLATAGKDRTHLFGKEQQVDLADPAVHAALRGWMNSETPATQSQRDALLELAGHKALPTEAADKIRAALDEGVTAYRAGVWIEQLTKKIDAALAAEKAADDARIERQAEAIKAAARETVAQADAVTAGDQQTENADAADEVDAVRDAIQDASEGENDPAGNGAPTPTRGDTE